MRPTLPLLLLLLVFSCSPTYDVIIRNGTVYDGSGQAAYQADIAIKNDTIAAIGDLSNESARKKVNARNLAVAPGFINMLSWANNSLITDGRGMSDIKQGVTLEVFGEGSSPGPLSMSRIKEMLKNGQTPRWRTLGGYFDYMEEKGV